MLSRASPGISFKTQLLYVIVFICRYVDLVTAPHYSLYNTVMKVFFIASSVYTLYLIKVKYRCVCFPAHCEGGSDGRRAQPNGHQSKALANRRSSAACPNTAD